MRLRVLWFGRAAADPYRAEVADYVRRLRRRWPAEDLPLKPHRAGRSEDPRRALEHEAAALVKAVPDGWAMVALDEGGRQMTSEGLARMVADRESAGAPGIAFVIGSDLGLAPEVARRADLVLSLSSLTLPHLIARLLLWEQLFRAHHILGGGRYHRQGVQ